MTLANGLQASLGGSVAWVGTDPATLITLVGSAMLLVTVGIMVFLALGPFYSAKWAEELGAADEGDIGSGDAAAGGSD